MSFPKRVAEITPYGNEGEFSLKITANGKFVSATIHPTEEAAQKAAAKKGARIEE